MGALQIAKSVHPIRGQACMQVAIVETHTGVFG